MKRLVLAAAAAATMLFAPAAQATVFTYAQYAQQNGTDTLQFANNGATAGGTLSAYAASVVNFWFFQDPSQDPLPAALLSNDATFALTATTSSNAAQFGSTILQNFESGSLSFTRTTPAGVGMNSGTNLLTISFTNLVLSGSAGGNAATLLSSTPTSTLTLTSDFFDFSMTNSKSFSISLSAVIPQLGIGANGSVNSFTADSSGTFSSDPAPTYVPEPGMIGLFGLGALGLGFARRRK